MSRIIKLTVIIAVAMLAWNPVSATGQDCETMNSLIKKERNLLKKKHLLTEALKFCPDDAHIHYSYAYTAERLRKYEKAQAHYLKATELDSNFTKAYFGLGDIYMVLGNASAAIAAFEKGLTLAPRNKRARAALELARIKHKSESGQSISSAEFIQVMQQSKTKETTQGAIDGPLLRMQIHFYSASSQLSQDAKDQLITVGKALEDPALNKQMFEISGHTDNTGTAEANLILSRDRAEQVRKYLLETFAIEPENLIVAYYGDTRPAVPNTTVENRALNRRVEFKRLQQ